MLEIKKGVFYYVVLFQPGYRKIGRAEGIGRSGLYLDEYERAAALSYGIQLTEYRPEVGLYYSVAFSFQKFNGDFFTCLADNPIPSAHASLSSVRFKDETLYLILYLAL